MIKGERYLFWNKDDIGKVTEAEFTAVLSTGRISVLCDDKYTRYFDCGIAIDKSSLSVEQLILNLHKHNDSINDERSALATRLDYNNKLIAMLTMELEK